MYKKLGVYVFSKEITRNFLQKSNLFYEIIENFEET